MSYVEEDLVYRTAPEPAEINIGDIFIEDEWYSKRAEWCNSHNCFIQEITQPDDVVRQFQIQEIPAPTDEELAKQVRATRDSLLEKTDYLLMSDYPISEEYLVKVKEYRQQLRDITEQESFPKNVVFPTLPEEKLNA